MIEMSSPTAYEVQRNFALSSGLRSEIIWDSLSPEQSDILHQKIKTLMPDSHKNRNGLEKRRKNLFESIWLQRKYTNRTLLSTIVYVLVTEEKDHGLAKDSNVFSCHPVFRTRKCINADNSAGCCMVFIDEHGRVYQNWNQFIRNNVLPKGTMIAPAKGIYTFNDNNDEVLLEFHPTPVSRIKSKILVSTDTVAGVSSLVATVPIAAALAFPVAAPVMVAATAVAVTTAAYSTVRSAMQLRDRRMHGQSTAPTDREARNSWLGVAGGVLGLGASGATKALTCASVAGQEISLATKVAVGGINVSSIVISGTGVVNGVYDLYLKINDDESLSGLDILQLASSLLVFTHSINNLKIASKIATRRNGSSIGSELKNQISKMFDKISAESSKLRSGKFDIIRTVNDIPIKDVLLSLHKINSHLNGAVAANGLASNILPNVLPAFSAGNAELNLLQLAEEFGCKFVQHISNFSSLLDVLNAMAVYLCERVFRFLMNLSRIFIDQNVDAIDRTLNTFVSTETVLYKTLMHCVTNYSDFSYAFLESKTTEILNEIDKYFNSLNPTNYKNNKRKCHTCNGHYYVCT